jgi:apocytochrome f|tara:strand:- start:1555 stop:2499 length:945 start_codon:yes stop_codon:yes gene_type:complete
MNTKKKIKQVLCAFTLTLSILSTYAQSSNAYPVFAQQGYANPRAANGKIACANCHLNQKAIEIEAPQAVLPNSIFEIEVKVPYDITKKQIGANGKKADLNVGGIVILPKGFKLAPADKISAEVKAKNKGVFISPYSTELDNILVVGPIAGKKHQELIFPVISPDPAKDPEIKYLTYPLYAGGNRGRGQVYPTGEKSNVNIYTAPQSGQISSIKEGEKGNRIITITNSEGKDIETIIPKGLDIIAKENQIIKFEDPLTLNPNAGGFGQEETELVLQNSNRIFGYLAFCFFVLLTQVFLILKKKQFEKVQAAELNF